MTGHTQGPPGDRGVGDPLLTSVGTLIAQVGRRHRGVARRLLTDLGLHPGQEVLLGRLWRRDGRRQSDLAARARVEAPTVSRMIDRLVAAGLVQRRPDPDDRRVSRVWLTDAGRALRPAVVDAWGALDAIALDGLDDDERATLRRLLGRVRRNLAADERRHR